MFSITGILTTKDKKHSGLVSVPLNYDTIHGVTNISFDHGDSVVILSFSRKNCAVCAEQIIKTFKPMDYYTFLSLVYKYDSEFDLWSAELKIIERI